MRIDYYMGMKNDRLCKVSRGFTLLEVLVVVVLLGILASIVIASFKTSEKETQSAVFARDIRVAADAFHVFCIQNDGVFPADQGPGVMPAEMSDYLGRMKWDEETSIGGKWDWDRGVFGVTAAMSVYLPDRTPAEMLEIDSLMDDGNLLAGNFRARPAGYMFIVQD